VTKKKNRIALASASILAVAGLTPMADAATTILYSTDFNGAAAGHTGNFATSPDYTDGGLIGQDGWAITGTSVVNPIPVTNSAVNGFVQMANNGQDVNRAFTPTAAASNGGSVFLSADLNVSAAQAGGDYFIHLSDGGTSNFNDRVYVKSTTGGYLMGLATGAGAANYGTSVLSIGTIYHFVAEYDYVAGGTNNDTVELYVNPTDPLIGGDNLYVNGATIGTDAVTIAAVNLRQGGAGSAPTLSVDNIAVSYVAPTPEPGSLALIGGAVAGFAGMRRRRPGRGLADEAAANLQK
jgi:hypothetical protein